MSATFYAIFLLGVALEVCLVWRLLSEGSWHSYPYFSFYVVYVAVGTQVLYAIQRFLPALYHDAYWGSESISVALRFLVIFEVFRHTFPRGTVLSRIVSKGFAVIGLLLSVFCVSSFWGVETYNTFHSVYPAIERSFGFAQAVLVLGLLMIARYYGVQLGRNLWGIAVAFGAYASMVTVNNAMVDLSHWFVPFWRVLSPLSFVAMLGMWAWAMWVYAPNPPLVAGEETMPLLELGEWTDRWNQTISTARRAKQS